MISDEVLMVYLDGQLGPERAREVETALAGDPALRTRLHGLQQVDQRVKTAFAPLLEQPVPDRLLERLRAARAGLVEPAAPAQPTPDNIVPLPSRSRSPEFQAPTAGAQRADGGERPRLAAAWVGWAAAAQVLLVIGAGLLVHAPAARPEFHALGSPPATPAANLLVAFRPDTPERRLRSTLKLIDARIVGGPTATSAYLLQVAPARRAAALAALRGRAEIVLAEPIDAGPAP